MPFVLVKWALNFAFGSTVSSLAKTLKGDGRLMIYFGSETESISVAEVFAIIPGFAELLWVYGTLYLTIGFLIGRFMNFEWLRAV